MSLTVITERYPAPPCDRQEILRYAGCRAADEQTLQLLQSCLDEVWDKLVYKVCFCESDVAVCGKVCDFGSFTAESEKLSRHLVSCSRVLLFGATVGIELDRLIARYGRISPARALMLQAIGAERIEALCDCFCANYEAQHGVTLTSRFSPGYGDLPLNVQKDLFRVLDCSRKIGLTLNESLLMSPSKSVTAFAGLGGETPRHRTDKCAQCENVNCAFRRTL